MHSMETLHITNLEGLERAVEKALALLTRKKEKKHAFVLALDGELGAGKTTFTQLLAKKLGVEEIVVSPTFVVMKFYTIQEDKSLLGVSQLVHIDAYRIESNEEMNVLHFDEMCKKEDVLICIEWAERIQALLPKNTVHMHIESNSDESRTITFT